MVYKPRRERRAKGGKAEEPLNLESGHKYNAIGSPEAKEEDEKSDGFKRGGMPKAKRKEGGKVEGHAAKHHLGKRARGGGMVAKEVREEKEEKHEKDGDMPERARGGHVSHKHHGEHHKRARGGGAPFSEGHKQVKGPDNDKDTGPGEQAPTIP